MPAAQPNCFSPAEDLRQASDVVKQRGHGVLAIGYQPEPIKAQRIHRQALKRGHDLKADGLAAAIGILLELCRGASAKSSLLTFGHASDAAEPRRQCAGDVPEGQRGRESADQENGGCASVLTHRRQVHPHGAPAPQLPGLPRKLAPAAARRICCSRAPWPSAPAS